MDHDNEQMALLEHFLQSANIPHKIAAVIAVIILCKDHPAAEEIVMRAMPSAVPKVRLIVTGALVQVDGESYAAWLDRIAYSVCMYLGDAEKVMSGPMAISPDENDGATG